MHFLGGGWVDIPKNDKWKKFYLGNLAFISQSSSLL